MDVRFKIFGVHVYLFSKQIHLKKIKNMTQAKSRLGFDFGPLLWQKCEKGITFQEKKLRHGQNYNSWSFEPIN